MCIVSLSSVNVDLVNNVHLAKGSFELSEFIHALSAVIIEKISVTDMH
jgi:hypothetical protein